MKKPHYVYCKNCAHIKYEPDGRALCPGFGIYLTPEQMKKGCENFK